MGQIAQLLRSGASDAEVAAAMNTVVNARFLKVDTIPENVTADARSELNSIGDAFKPGRYSKGARPLAAPLLLVGL